MGNNPSNLSSSDVPLMISEYDHPDGELVELQLINFNTRMQTCIDQINHPHIHSAVKVQWNHVVRAFAFTVSHQSTTTGPEPWKNLADFAFDRHQFLRDKGIDDISLDTFQQAILCMIQQCCPT